MISVLASNIMDQVTDILIAGGLLVLAVVVLVLGVWYYRRRLLSDDDASDGTPWTFEDLRRMRDEGELTRAEYDALREQMISAFRDDRPSSESSSGGGRDR